MRRLLAEGKIKGGFESREDQRGQNPRPSPSRLDRGRDEGREDHGSRDMRREQLHQRNREALAAPGRKVADKVSEERELRGTLGRKFDRGRQQRQRREQPAKPETRLGGRKLEQRGGRDRGERRNRDGVAAGGRSAGRGTRRCGSRRIGFGVRWHYASGIARRTVCDHACVERAGTKSLQINRDEAKADFFELALDGVAILRLEDARDLAALQLQPRNLAMKAHARDFESHRVQDTLAGRNFRESLGRYLGAVWKPRREAWRRRTIPGRQA